jgi:hypothetical protein
MNSRHKIRLVLSGSLLLGHSSIGLTLEPYSHVLPDLQASAAAAMDSAFGVG